MTIDSEEPSRFLAAKQRIYAIVGVSIALGWPFLQVLLIGEKRASLTSAEDEIRTALVEWIVFLVLVGIAFGLQHLRPAFFRFRAFKWRDILYMLAAFAGP